MIFENMKTLLLSRGEIVFKLYSLEYTIKLTNNEVIIYPTDYEKHKRKFNSFDELINDYLIYQEPLINFANKIKVL